MLLLWPLRACSCRQFSRFGPSLLPRLACAAPLRCSYMHTSLSSDPVASLPVLLNLTALIGLKWSPRLHSNLEHCVSAATSSCGSRSGKRFQIRAL